MGLEPACAERIRAYACLVTDRAPPDTELATLAARARDGDRAALDALVARIAPRVYRFGMKMCRSPDDAEDIAQDTMMAVSRSIAGWKGEASLSTWLFTIARSFCIKKRRRSKFAPREHAPLEAAARGLPDPSPGADEALAEHELRRAIEQAIETLDPKYREVLVLRDVEGLHAPEVAAVTGLKVDTVKTRLHRARAMLRERLGPLLDAGETAVPGCPDLLPVFSQHLEGDIDAARCAEMERHLDACPRCRGACSALRHVLQLCRTAPGPTVPESVQASIRAAVAGLRG